MTETFFDKFIKPDVVLVLLVIFCASATLNIIFLVRCCLVQRYVRKMSRYSVENKTETFPVLWQSMKREANAVVNYGNSKRHKEDQYDNIREGPSMSETSKSKSSIEYLSRPKSNSSEITKMSPSDSQLSRSSTFPIRQSILVHTPNEAFPINPLAFANLENVQQIIYPYPIDPAVASSVSKTPFNAGPRFSIHGIYDDVAGDLTSLHNHCSTMPIRHFASTGSLYKRGKVTLTNHPTTSPLPEEVNGTTQKFLNFQHAVDDDAALITNDMSSLNQDISSSEDAYLSGQSDNARDTAKATKLELSKQMMAKADTLLREAHNLLKQT